uniref:Uncharacterized protein n=1 Tax=Lactuca sativa TaxID=4236 RepID=A0A9R1WW06_LACSA|nr:hypothetical protein LSAT_V11C800394890 [Lactuca sativa]
MAKDVVGGEGEPGFRKPSSVSSYDEAMDALSSLITKKNRADKIVVDHRYELMFEYVKILELEEPISQMKIIHVAGTKGKVKMDQHACSLKLSYAIVAFALDSSHLLTSLMLEKDFNWMGEFSRFITLICSTFNCRRLFNFPNFGLFQ